MTSMPKQRRVDVTKLVGLGICGASMWVACNLAKPSAKADAGSGAHYVSVRTPKGETAFVTTDGRCFANLSDGGVEEDKSLFCRAVFEAEKGVIQEQQAREEQAKAAREKPPPLLQKQ